MYPAKADCNYSVVGIATLPDGRQVRAYSEGYTEGDTNATVETEGRMYFVESGDELTLEEMNSEIVVDGQRYFLHEYVYEHAKWETD